MPGISEAIYIGGLTISTAVTSYAAPPGYAKSDERLADGTLQTDALWPEDGDPDLLTKRTFPIAWQALNDPDIVGLARLFARIGAFDFCPWQVEVEQWTFAAGDSYAGVLRRRNALDFVSQLPPDAATRYAIAAELNGVAKAITLGTVADYRTPWTATGTASEGDVISIAYWPIYRVKRTNDEPTYPEQNVQGVTATFEEA